MIQTPGFLAHKFLKLPCDRGVEPAQNFCSAIDAETLQVGMQGDQFQRHQPYSHCTLIQNQTQVKMKVCVY